MFILCFSPIGLLGFGLGVYYRLGEGVWRFFYFASFSIVVDFKDVG